MDLRQRLVEHRETLFELLGLRVPRSVASAAVASGPVRCGAPAPMGTLRLPERGGPEGPARVVEPCAGAPAGELEGGRSDAGETCAGPGDHVTEGALPSNGGEPDELRWLEAGIRGRAFTVDGLARWSEPCFDPEWTRDVPAPPVPVLEAADGERVTAHWLERAATEHAAVAAFAQFTLDLVHFGAPPRLLSGAARAMAQEVEHARLCYAIASVLAGEPIAPGPLEVHGGRPSPSLRTLLVSTLREACVGEACGAAEAVWLAERSDEPVVRAALERIARDELHHAALGWDTVRWGLALERDLSPDEVRSIVLSAVADVVTAADDADIEDTPALARYGLVPVEERRAVYLAAAEHVIAPCCDALLHTPTHCPGA